MKKVEKCPIHYHGQDYWAVALCELCEAYLKSDDF